MTSCAYAPVEAVVEGLYQVRHAVTQDCITPVGDRLESGQVSLRLSPECEDGLLTTWEIAEDTEGWLIRNVALDLYWDIFASGSSDGSELISFPYQNQDNQRFAITERSPTRFQMAPLHASSQCLERVDDRVELYACDASRGEQEWILEALQCGE
jgi:hypothetical protein